MVVSETYTQENALKRAHILSKLSGHKTYVWAYKAWNGCWLYDSYLIPKSKDIIFMNMYEIDLVRIKDYNGR